MFRDTLLEKLTGMESRPNKFTIGMGKLIRQGREEAGLSQRDLAERIYRRQAALSDMENGKMEPDASTLLLLSHNLRKPIGYFFPDPYKPEIVTGDLSEEANILIIQAKRLSEDDLKRLIVQAKALADLSKL